MDFQYSDKTLEVRSRLLIFMDEHIYPNEEQFQQELKAGDRWEPVALIEELKQKARDSGIWNLFLPEVCGLVNVEYSPLAEFRGHQGLACSVSSGIGKY